ncbi:hypothetical protein EPUS_05587 [Endocarpon pusillum Z07020]|uniref:CCHC-type domain-containing protein n=1 Tax=Endocarpon pusillum (strain Z07020 / HMAS-L-300199) TaxID=1263415 RepID=U1HN08_ENDPU|nr:uncharacterized protein EPUS_05587 [Endocarpon pusillum Z07020]ERF71715.1 hypothetical protein EPUS_05587 [Endocarpon pusillum Z07020]
MSFIYSNLYAGTVASSRRKATPTDPLPKVERTLNPLLTFFLSPLPRPILTQAQDYRPCETGSYKPGSRRAGTEPPRSTSLPPPAIKDLRKGTPKTFSSLSGPKDILADFTRLASQISKSSQDQYKDLQEKMSAELLREIRDRTFYDAGTIAHWVMEQKNRLILIRRKEREEERIRNRARPNSPRPDTRRPEARTTPGKAYPFPLALTAGPPRRSPTPSPGQATSSKSKCVGFKKDDTVTCFYCNKPGYVKPDCPDLYVSKIKEAESDFGDKSSGPDEESAESENEMP